MMSLTIFSFESECVSVDKLLLMFLKMAGFHKSLVSRLMDHSPQDGNR